MKIAEIKQLMSESGHATDSCLIWSAEDMRNAIQWKLSPDQDLNLSDAQCKQLLDEFFLDYGDAIVSEIHENMSAWISDRIQDDNLGL
jgi:hypothetical protein